MRRRPRLPLDQLAPYLLEARDSEEGTRDEGRGAREEGSSSLAPRPSSLVPSSESLVRRLSPLDWREIFGNDHAVELEVGFGKGLFLLTAAQAHPEINFVGVEIVRKYQLFAATRLAKRGLQNVRVACADVQRFLPNWVATASLQKVHVYFPDPWWKKRHQKRRVFTAEFVRECVRALRPGGQLHAVTDVPEYAAVMSTLLVEQSALRPLPPPPEKEPLHDLDYLTNFERKFRKLGKAIYRMRYEKGEG